MIDGCDGCDCFFCRLLMAKVYSALVECCCIAQSQREEAGWQAGRDATILINTGNRRQTQTKQGKMLARGGCCDSFNHSFLIGSTAFRQVIMYD